MNQKINLQFILLFCLTLAFVACNNKSKKEEPAQSDTTATVSTEPAQTNTMDPAMDATKVAPDQYKLIKDTLGIRTIEATYKPGDSSASHSHLDYVVYAVTNSNATFYPKGGEKMVSELKAGLIMVRPAETHSVKNETKNTFKVFFVEVNRPVGGTPTDAAMDVVKIAPKEYTVAKDTMGIRVLEFSYKPGDTSAMHSHPDNALYVTEGGKAEFTAKDGTKTVMELKKGQSVIRPAGEHAVKNIGKTTMKGVLVEVNRAMR